MALIAIKDEAGLLQACADAGISKSSALEWKEKLLLEAEKIFLSKSEQDKQVNELKKKIESLTNVIGQLTIENSFLKKKLFA
jgi:uncharacterized protein involved in tolerance to divalent cations